MKSYTKTCEVCGTEFETYNNRNRSCSKECTKVLKYPVKTKVCECCGNEYETSSSKAKYCSRKCTSKAGKLKNRAQEIIKSREKYDETYPECRICGLRGINLTSHINRIHELSEEEYKTKFGIDDISELYTESYRQKLSENMMGENNVWYNHKGKYSPFSKNNINYKELSELEIQEQIDTVIGKAVQTRNENGTETTRLEYYLNQGMSEEDARAALKERQTTFNLEKCIERYGAKEGPRIWKERQDKWQDTLTSKSQEEIDDINRRKFSGGGHSKISQELFESLKIQDARYGINGGEYRVKLNNGKHASLDFWYNGKIIEFFGDLWHANPKKFKAADKPLLSKIGISKSAKEIWQKDQGRLEQLHHLGYEILVIWESEYKQDKEKAKQKCLEFLKT